MASEISNKEDEVVTLNVGGARYQTRRRHLLRTTDGSFFYNLGQNARVDEEQFVDQSADTFVAVMRWIRTGEIHLPRSDPHLWRALGTDAQRLGMNKLLAALRVQYRLIFRQPLLDTDLYENDDLIPVSAGGVRVYDVRYANLYREPGSVLGQWYTQHKTPATGGREIRLDTDPEAFVLIAHYLRTGNLRLPDDYAFLMRLNDEGRMLGLVNLVTDVRERLDRAERHRQDRWNAFEVIASGFRPNGKHKWMNFSQK